MPPDNATSLFNDLLGDWERYARSPAACAALSRWRAAESSLAGCHSAEEVIAVLRDPADLQRRDERTLAMLRLARDDVDARRVMLQALWPGLLRLTTIYGSAWDYEDTAASVVLLALERIAKYPLRRRQRVAANLIKDVQHGLHVARTREHQVAAVLGVRIPIEDASAVAASDGVAAAEELLDLVGEAVRRHRLTERQARLIVMRRVFDVPTAETARDQGANPSTIRQTRNRGETRLARMFRAELACA